MAKKTYDKNNNPIKATYPAKHFPYEHKRTWLHKEMYKLNGNGWWWFHDCQGAVARKSWLERYKRKAWG